MKLSKWMLMCVLALLAAQAGAADSVAPMDDIQAYCDEQADAAGLGSMDEGRTAFVKMCVDSETESAAAEGQGGDD